jgi:hypothetical protein
LVFKNLDPDSLEMLDPDPYPDQSGSTTLNKNDSLFLQQSKAQASSLGHLEHHGICAQSRTAGQRNTAAVSQTLTSI